MSLLQEALDACATLTRRVEHLEYDKRVDTLDDTIMEDVSNQGRMIDELDRDEGAVLMSEKEEKKAEDVKDITGDAQVEGSKTVSAVVVPAATETAAPDKVVVPSTRQRRGVITRDPKEESYAQTPTKTKSNDKGKGIMVEEPKPMKKKQQVELDESYARKLHEELNQYID
nr:hypothetical protein [Tanacetum cinerariifolium]